MTGPSAQSSPRLLTHTPVGGEQTPYIGFRGDLIVDDKGAVVPDQPAPAMRSSAMGSTWGAGCEPAGEVRARCGVRLKLK